MSFISTLEPPHEKTSPQTHVSVCGKLGALRFCLGVYLTQESVAELHVELSIPENTTSGSLGVVCPVFVEALVELF